MLSRHDLNPNALRAQYAVRGPIVARAEELEQLGRNIIYCNIGNPQALGQRPSTFLRQLLSLVEYPALLDDPRAAAHYPPDVLARARLVLAKHPPGTGAYTQSCGLPFVRQAVAEFIARRDGIAADPERIILTDGASRAIELVLAALLRGPSTGILIPVPQYPLYGAVIDLYGGRQIPYDTDEGHDWQPSEAGLADAVTRAHHGGASPAAIVVVNPGNPTGAVLSYQNLRMVVEFARSHNLAILADEVYQDNVWVPDRRFHSFARLLDDLDERDVALFSFHSVSKGFLGECGHRGGYVEMRNVPADVVAELVKLQSFDLCANVAGQLATYAMVAPPAPGDASYAAFAAERDAVLRQLKAKAELLERGINAIEGMRLEMPQGAMYGFVRFELPCEADVDPEGMTRDERRTYEATRDTQYCLALLEETGVCVVPGSGFGQPPGTFHFRTTFLPPVEQIEELVARLGDFHQRYVEAMTTA